MTSRTEDAGTPAKVEEERVVQVEETRGIAVTEETAQSSDNEQPNIDAVSYRTFFKDTKLIPPQESEYDGEGFNEPEEFE